MVEGQAKASTTLPMEAIKKKMLAMKLDKENAIDLADQLEEQLKEKETEMSKKEEEMGDVVKRYQSLEAEKEAAETQLAETNQKLEDTEKRAQEVSTTAVIVMQFIIALQTHGSVIGWVEAKRISGERKDKKSGWGPVNVSGCQLTTSSHPSSTFPHLIG
ncbi:unnamed protein product [Hydatigera taeniaeformis]|uniref:Tropomyosin n=1 Tax=Hydatigena taeniaeformis TaxID=6205 RepID=A0A0R3WVE5_HYDTA|nr:unnamed protein product [Hydatigera taeniaeformis]